MRTWLGLGLFFAAFSLAACSDGGLAPGAGDGGTTAADLASPTCSSFHDRASCTAQPGCEAAGCPSCANVTFIGCYPKGQGPIPVCPQIECAQPCGDYKDAATCDGAGSCFSVYNDPGTCDCTAPGCCMAFDHCGSKPLNCTGTSSTCLWAPACGGAYVNVYEGACSTGCVKKSMCESD